MMPARDRASNRRAVIVCQSRAGAMRSVADAIAEGVATKFRSVVLDLERSTDAVLREADLVVIGVDKVGTTDGPNPRRWFGSLGSFDGCAASFTVQLDRVTPWSPHPSKAVTNRLQRHGFHIVAEPETFLVRDRRLLEAEDIHAFEWGIALAGAAASARRLPSPRS